MDNNIKLNANQNFLKSVFEGQAMGQSVSEVCNKLAGGDKFKCLRLIAKFKTLLANNKEDVLFVINKLKTNGITVESPYNPPLEKVNDKASKSNVIAFEPPATISESELNSLFLGLCKLVKRLANEEANNFYKQKQKETEIKLKRQIENLQLLNEGLAMENKRLSEKICNSTLQNW